jgi:hypothetical protein
MKFSFKSFAIGFACAALSLGAVTYANAAGNGTLKACANKTSGTMRYISKGSCKKTETSLSWNQMGPQGLPGAAGTNGTDGAAGTKGDTGSTGTNGANGKVLFVVDAEGKTIGQVVGDGSGGNQYSTVYTTLVGNKIWFLSSNNFRIDGIAEMSDYSNPTCTSRLGATLLLAQPPSQATFGYMSSSVSETYIASSKYADLSDLTKPVYTPEGGTCRLRTSTERDRTDVSLWNLEAITPPTYTAPLTIVAK